MFPMAGDDDFHESRTNKKYEKYHQTRQISCIQEAFKKKEAA